MEQAISQPLTGDVGSIMSIHSHRVHTARTGSTAVPVQSKQIYGPLARNARKLLCGLSKPYTCTFHPLREPCVYVCRHLNMHGPFTTLKWIPTELHPFVLNVFMDEKSAVKQFTEYTFSERRGRKPRRFSLCGTLLGNLAAKIVRSLQSVPVYRDSSSIKTMRSAMHYLQNGDSLIVWPDVNYTDGYDKPCEIYQGFLYLGEVYHKKTGKELPFIPLYINDSDRIISAGVPLVINQYAQDCESAVRELKQALNGDFAP